MRLWVVNFAVLTAFSLIVLASCPAQDEAEKPVPLAKPVVQSVTPESQQPARPVDNSAWVGDAIDFTFTSFAGDSVRASSFAGKPVVLNFWASW